MAHAANAKKAYPAWQQGDSATVLSLLADDFVNYRWNPSIGKKNPGVPWSGVWRGKDACLEWMKVGSALTEQAVTKPMLPFLLQPRGL
jgi:ketosteroid isomerase-like protein